MWKNFVRKKAGVTVEMLRIVAVLLRNPLYSAEAFKFILFFVFNLRQETKRAGEGKSCTISAKYSWIRNAAGVGLYCPYEDPEIQNG